MSKYTKKISQGKEQLHLFDSPEAKNLPAQKNCDPPHYRGPKRFQKIGPNGWSKITNSPETNFTRKYCMCKKFDDGIFCQAFSYCQHLKGNGSE